MKKLFKYITGYNIRVLHFSPFYWSCGFDRITDDTIILDMGPFLLKMEK